MSGAAVRLGVGTRLSYDGELVEVVELLSTAAGNEVVLRNGSGQRVWRVAVKELLAAPGTRLLPVGQVAPVTDEHDESVGVMLAELTDRERQQLLDRAAHVREVLTGYRSGSRGRAATGLRPGPSADGQVRGEGNRAADRRPHLATLGGRLPPGRRSRPGQVGR